MRILEDHVPWFGEHSGYEQLTRHLIAAGVEVELTRSRTTPGQIRLGRWLGRLQRNANPNPVYAAAELRFRWRRGGSLRHVLYGEAHHTLYSRRRARDEISIATLHHPLEQWPEWPDTLPRHLSRLTGAIVLARKDAAEVGRRLELDHVYFSPHGVDTDFFRPDDRNVDRVSEPRVLYAGQNGRDVALLHQVLDRLVERRPRLRFDLLVRATIRDRYGPLSRLASHPSVRWHEGLSDLELRKLYQGSTVLLLPLLHCGAVNSLLEALACGLPVVTNDVGGVPDYGGGDVYPTAPPADAEAMVALVEAFLDRPAWRRDVAARGRRLAEDLLAWPRVAARHVEIYRDLLDRTRRERRSDRAR